MKKLLATLLAFTMVFVMVGCSGSSQESEAPKEEEAATEPAEEEAAQEEEEAEPEAEPVELIVFAAASMTETLEEIKGAYEAEHSNVTLTFNFDSSGTLQTQIEEGADCDLFISAAKKQMDALEEGGLIDTSTRIDLLENKVALVVPEGNPKGVESFEQLAELLSSGQVLMAMGNSDVPVGQYTQKILEYFGLVEEDLANNNVISYGTNVKEVTTQVTEGSVDCGVVYATDAFSAGLEVMDTATEEMCGRAIYPAAVLANCEKPEAKEFLDYLTGSDAMKVFEGVGFSKAE